MLDVHYILILPFFYSKGQSSLYYWIFLSLALFWLRMSLVKFLLGHCLPSVTSELYFVLCIGSFL